jgi:MFS family permease
MTSPTPTLSAQGLPKGAWMALLAAFLGWMFDGVEMGLFPLVSKPALTELVTDATQRPLWNGIIVAAFLLGAACGGAVFGWLGDRFGRVRALSWTILTYSVFSGMCGFAHDPYTLAGLRFCSALGMGGEWALGVALVMEVWPARWRPLLAGVIGAALNIGLVAIAVAGLYVKDLGAGLSEMGLGNEAVSTLTANGGWRMLMMLGAAPALLTFLLTIFVPESKAWEHAASTAPAARFSEVFSAALRKRTLLAAALATVALLGTWGSVQILPIVADSLDGKSETARQWTQIWSGSGSVVGALIAAVLAQALNRRLTYALMCLLSLGACAWLFRTHQVYDGAFLGWVFVVGAVTASFYGWLPLYLPELFPTRLRAAAQGFAFNSGRILTAVGVVIMNGLVKDVFHGSFAEMCATVSLIYIVGLVVIWFCPETKGQPLPE